MELKKNPKADLESKKGIFLLIGLIISLSLSIWAYESKSYDKQDIGGLGDLDLDDLDEEDIDITRPEPPPPPEELPPPPPEVPEEIEIKENEDKLDNEVNVENMEDDQNTEMEIEEDEEMDPRIWVDNMPKLGTCQDEACTQKAIMQFIMNKFDYPHIAKDQGIEGRMIMTFVVGISGKVTDIEVLKDENEFLSDGVTKNPNHKKEIGYDKGAQHWNKNIKKIMVKAAVAAIESFNDKGKRIPRFSPGSFKSNEYPKGKKVPIKYTVPIKCTLAG